MWCSVDQQFCLTLELNQRKMQHHYNRNLRFIDSQEDERVWLKTNPFKTGGNPKLAPRRNGPWTVIEKLPNGVNFRIKNAHKETKIVHHDRLLPVKIVPTEFREHEALLDNDNPSVEESSSDEDLFSLNSFTSSDN